MKSTTVVELRDPSALAAALAEAKLSPRKLAARIDVSSSRIHQLVTGQHQSIAVEKALAIAAELEREPAVLWTFPDGDQLIRLGLISA